MNKEDHFVIFCEEEKTVNLTEYRTLIIVWYMRKL